MDTKKEFDKAVEDVWKQIDENDKNLEEAAEIFGEAWALHTNKKLTPGVLKAAKLERLAPKAKVLSALVKEHSTADTAALLSLVEGMMDERVKPTNNDAADILELLGLMNQPDIAHVESWAQDLEGAGGGAVELVSLWEDIKGNKNIPAITVGMLIQMLKRAKYPEDKMLLDLLEALAKK
jgi:hypothetical protein